MENLDLINIRNLIDESINRAQEHQLELSVSQANIEPNEDEIETDFYSAENGFLLNADENNRNSHLLSGAEAVSLYERFKETKIKQFQRQVMVRMDLLVDFK